MTLALDWTRMIPSLPYKLYRIIVFGLFVVMAIREAIKENVLHASAPHANSCVIYKLLRKLLIILCMVRLLISCAI